MLSWRKLNQPSRWVLLLLFGVVFLSSLLVDEIQGLSSSLPSSCTAATTTATAPPPTNTQSPCRLRSRRQLLQETWNNGVGMFVGSAILGVGVTTITPSRAEAAPPYVTLRFCFEAYYIPPPYLIVCFGSNPNLNFYYTLLIIILHVFYDGPIYIAYPSFRKNLDIFLWPTMMVNSSTYRNGLHANPAHNRLHLRSGCKKTMSKCMVPIGVRKFVFLSLFL